jgi:hypothetical protein
MCTFRLRSTPNLNLAVPQVLEFQYLPLHLYSHCHDNLRSYQCRLNSDCFGHLYRWCQEPRSICLEDASSFVVYNLDTSPQQFNSEVARGERPVLQLKTVYVQKIEPLQKSTNQSDKDCTKQKEHLKTTQDDSTIRAIGNFPQASRLALTCK